VSEERWLTVAQVAEILQLGLTTVYSEIRSGRLRAAHVGGGGRTIRIPPSSLAEYQALCEAENGSTAKGWGTPAVLQGGRRAIASPR
jgi:excisionase family DNA binding protein